MATLANLRVLLEADTSRFRQGMRDARESINRISVAAAGAATGLGAIVKQGLDSADELQKLSLRTGASVEALSALRHQADLSDTSVASLERGLVSMNRAIADAETGTKAQADAFAALNVDMAVFRQLKPEQQFAVLADRLTGLGDEARAAALGNDIFGGSYRRLAPLLKSGSDGMRQAQEEARRLGLVLTQEQADAAAQANDSLTRLQATVSGLAAAFAVELAPSIDKAVSGITERLPHILAGLRIPLQVTGEWIGGLSAAAGQFLSGNFAGAASIAANLPSDLLDTLNTEIDKLPALQEDGNQYLRQIAENTGNGPRAQ